MSNQDFVNVLIPHEAANLQLPDEELLNYYTDLENRILWIDDEICDLSLLYVRNILNWNRQDRDIPIDQRKPIKILFHSVGGDVDMQDMISSIISLSKTPVIGIAMGMVASAASYIFLHCHKRYMLKTSYFLFHKGSIGVNGNATDVLSLMADYEKQLEILVNRIIEMTTFTSKEVFDNMSKDWYIRSSLALEKGVVDGIIEDIEVLL